MIKRTLYFGNPAYLSVKDEQLLIRVAEGERPENFKKEITASIPIEDIGIVVFDHPQITCTHSVFERLLNNNAAVITCNNAHLPIGLLLPLDGNTTQSERFSYQIEASTPLKKQLWQQTIEQKILNQAAVLSSTNKTPIDNMRHWAASVKSGDSENHEARAAAYYWQNLFPKSINFTRERDGFPPNNLLNYGYAILRAIVARSLVSSGLLPTLGIHHHNKYNAYCLADDVMEPYRPFVDKLVIEIMHSVSDYEELSKEIKAKLLTIPTIDVLIDGQKSPLMLGVTQTTASLYRCFQGSQRKISYPVIK